MTQKRHLRGEKGLQELENILSIQDIRNVQEAEHMPLYCLDVITNFLQESFTAGSIPAEILARMDFNIGELVLAIGGCERIKNTPFPVAFVVLMRAFLVIWLVTLPLMLAKTMGWATVGVCFIITIAVLGIDAMAVEIENPFGHDYNDLPLGSFCEIIAKNVREMLDRSQHPDRKRAFDGEPPVW